MGDKKLKSSKNGLLYLKQLILHRKYLSRITGPLVALIIFYMICSALNYMYVQYFGLERAIWHDFYVNNGKIDNIYLGSSHVYQGINSILLDNINGEHNFNLASSGQPLNGSYYLLKEADKGNVLSHVYLELFYLCNVKDDVHAEVDVNDSYNWRNSDYMKTSYNKFEYMLSIAGKEKYVDTFFPFSRYRTKLDNWDYIRQTMESKRTDTYFNFKHYVVISDENVYREYKGQGYYYTSEKFLSAKRLYGQERILKGNPIGEKSEKYMRKIITYCQKRDIPITLFVSPIDELQLVSTECYDNYINQIREIADEYGIEFYDFNLTKEEYLDIQHGEYFMDVGHLNYKGADMFTTFFNKVTSSTESEKEKYFYVSYEEKLQSTVPAIYGLYYRDSNGFRTYHVATNRENGVKYRITLLPTPNESGGDKTVSLTRLL